MTDKWIPTSFHELSDFTHLRQRCFILKVKQHNIRRRRRRQRPLGTPCQSVGVDMSVSLGQLIAGRKAASPARLA